MLIVHALVHPSHCPHLESERKLRICLFEVTTRDSATDSTTLCKLGRKHSGEMQLSLFHPVSAKYDKGAEAHALSLGAVSHLRPPASTGSGQ